VTVTDFLSDFQKTDLNFTSHFHKDRVALSKYNYTNVGKRLNRKFETANPFKHDRTEEKVRLRLRADDHKTERKVRRTLEKKMEEGENSSSLVKSKPNVTLEMVKAKLGFTFVKEPTNPHLRNVHMFSSVISPSGAERASRLVQASPSRLSQLDAPSVQSQSSPLLQNSLYNKIRDSQQAKNSKLARAPQYFPSSGLEEVPSPSKPQIISPPVEGRYRLAQFNPNQPVEHKSSNLHVPPTRYQTSLRSRIQFPPTQPSSASHTKVGRLPETSSQRSLKSQGKYVGATSAEKKEVPREESSLGDVQTLKHSCNLQIIKIIDDATTIQAGTKALSHELAALQTRMSNDVKKKQTSNEVRTYLKQFYPHLATKSKA